MVGLCGCGSCEGCSVDDERKGGKVLNDRQEYSGHKPGDHRRDDDVTKERHVGTPQGQGKASEWRESCAALWTTSIWEKPTKPTTNRPSIAVMLRGMIFDVESPTAVAADFVDIVLSFRPPPEGIRSIFCRRQVSWLADLAPLSAFPGKPQWHDGSSEEHTSVLH